MFRMRSHFCTPFWHSLPFGNSVRWAAVSTCASSLRQEGAGQHFSAAPPRDQGCSQGWAVWPYCLPGARLPPTAGTLRSSAGRQLLGASGWPAPTGWAALEGSGCSSDLKCNPTCHRRMEDKGDCYGQDAGRTCHSSLKNATCMTQGLHLCAAVFPSTRVGTGFPGLFSTGRGALYS